MNIGFIVLVNKLTENSHSKEKMKIKTLIFASITSASACKNETDNGVTENSSTTQGQSTSFSTTRDTDINTATHFDISSSSSASASGNLASEGLTSEFSTSESSTSESSTSESLTSENSISESSTGISPFCGDGNTDENEECDSEENCNECYLCGNQIVAPVEECDDGNKVVFDGCNNCKIEHVAFVTSVPFTGNLGGISGANKICQNLANKASKNDNFKFGDLEFKAWISDDKQNPYDSFSLRLRNFKGIIRKPGGKGILQDIVADNGWNDIIGNSLFSRLDYDEYGNHINNIVHVWSNVDAPSDPQHYCTIGDFSWVSEDEKNYGNIGFTGAINKDWTFYKEDINEISCSKQHRLYCFSQ